MIFKKSAGDSGPGAEQLWFGAGTNETDLTLLSRTKSTKDYVSRLTAMPKYFAEERFEVATGGGVQKTIVFDTIEASLNDLFVPSRVKSSSWTDLPTQANWDNSALGRYFSVFGTTGRDFYINNNFGGCSADQGWLNLTTTSGCGFDGGTAGKILYASGTTMQLGTSMAAADTFMIFGR